jgi:hypothetical protein
VLRRRGGEAQQWTTYDPAAAPWAPTPPESDLARGTSDAAGASPTEAVADAEDRPHEPTTPQAPAAQTVLDGQPSAPSAPAKKTAAKKAPPTKRSAAKKTAPPRRDVPPET